jgi:hypothetical protein
MDYKVKLQNNNNVFKDNNTDLQAVLETINNLPTAGISENLDEEIATQEEKIASQDELIAGIAAALEGKAAGGGSSSKIINLNWDDDIESTCEIVYLSNDGVKRLYRGDNITTIIANYGVVVIFDPNSMSSYNDTFIQLITELGQGYEHLIYTLIATQDNETIYLVSTNQK